MALQVIRKSAVRSCIGAHHVTLRRFLFAQTGDALDRGCCRSPFALAGFVLVGASRCPRGGGASWGPRPLLRPCHVSVRVPSLCGGFSFALCGTRAVLGWCVEGVGEVGAREHWHGPCCSAKSRRGWGIKRFLYFIAAMLFKLRGARQVPRA